MMAVNVEQRLPRLIFGIDPRYLAGQESALVNALNGNPGVPTFTPPRPFERGVGRRPTLVQNVETLAHLALIARHGADWFRQLGTPRHQRSALVTLSGALAAPGVSEIEHGTSLIEPLQSTGVEDELSAVLVDGHFGTWLTASEAPGVRLAGEYLAGYSATLGAGVIVALGASPCPVAETSRIADSFAAESAGRRGPCVYGLDAIAYTIHQLPTGTETRHAHADLEPGMRELPRRGACQQPDGAVRFIASSLRVFD